MRILGHMATKNEMGRWLTSTLPWLSELCHGAAHVYDDRSDDGTDDYALSLGLPVDHRPDGVVSFAENEGLYRWTAWRAMERALSPRRGDWILVIDADELLVSTTANAEFSVVVAELVEAIHVAESAGERTITFRVAEIFQFDDMGWPMERIDGYWGSITACRLARWQAGGIFEARKEGGGSLPSGWPRSTTVEGHLEIVHLGYARPEDRAIKHQRYSTGPGHGHNAAHVRSILTPPSLQHWSGMRLPRPR